MILTIIAIILFLWLLGFGFSVGGSAIYLLPIVAVAIATVSLLTGRRLT